MGRPNGSKGLEVSMVESMPQFPAWKDSLLAGGFGMGLLLIQIALL